MERLTRNVLTETSPMYELGEWADNEEALDKLGQLEDVEEKHNISSLDDLDKKLTVLEIIKKHYDVNFLEVSPNYFIAYSVYKDDEDLKKVKEWLEK